MDQFLEGYRLRDQYRSAYIYREINEEECKGKCLQLDTTQCGGIRIDGMYLNFDTRGFSQFHLPDLTDENFQNITQILNIL